MHQIVSASRDAIAELRRRFHARRLEMFGSAPRAAADNGAGFPQDAASEPTPERSAAMIDIDGLSEAELLALNHRIIARVRVQREVRAHEAMMAFRVGDRVSFQTNRGEVTGVLTRYNRKTVTVMADADGPWNVSPNVLRKAGPPARDGTGPVIDGEILP